MPQPLAFRRKHKPPHLVRRARLPEVVATGELVDVAIEVLGRYLVVDADVAALLKSSPNNRST